MIFDGKEGSYKPTDKAEEMLKPLVDLKRMIVLNTIAAVIILLVGFALMLGGHPLLFIFNLFISLYLYVVNFHSVRPFSLLFKKFKKSEFLFSF